MIIPVIITTLNRYEHFARCVESLEKCAGSDRIALYVSVDYPPSEKYEDGHKKICEYLKTRNWDCFESANIFYQEKNLGPVGNPVFLQTEVKKRFSYYAQLEDDNEVSTNYILYISECLSRYADSTKTIAIGITPLKTRYESGEVAFRCKYAFDGNYATYFSWIEEARKWINRENFVIILKNRKLSKKIYKEGFGLYYALVAGSLAGNYYKHSLFYNKEEKLNHNDITYSLYMYVNNVYVIRPTKYKTRNWGMHDGSGVNFDVMDESVNPLETEIDMDHDFSLPAGELREIFEDDLIPVGSKKLLFVFRVVHIFTLIFGVSAGKWLFKELYKIRIVR